MTKVEFMNQLEACLQEISLDERQSALHYYEEYFEEAGEDENAVENLDSPEKIAKAIKEDLDIRMQTVRSNLKDRNTPKKDKQSKEDEQKPTEKTISSSNLDVKKIILLIVVGIVALSVLSNIGHSHIAFPFWHGGILSGVLGLFFVVIGITIAGYLMTLGGGLLFITSIVTMFTSGLHGLFMMGVSLFFIGFGMVFITASNWFWKTVVPGFVKMIKNAFSGKESEEGVSS
ncbi:MAG: DUF1700 domain-containing protein [Lachnoclostridium sp.]|jgi:uncharacterized membrane protein|nr:DUF1700 domain-containing protein [Lachnoclostridium sp.]